ncbi:hypothetical protein [Eleftheria terrae]|uniref:hypothetical protein n=1 Tax=Eleftheria terrae TaxID=1597781 RepID=UPI00263A52B7|nr:hypothetical protein [Eleftheria terrae]WKB55519.1 hypothetical protein N7L95_25930 [Eleftheria terrae]
MPKPDLWSLIEAMPGHLPFSRQSIESALDVRLKVDSENEYFVFLVGGPVALNGGVVIDLIDLRVRKEQPHPGFLVLRLAGDCLPRSQVLERYPGMSIGDTPRGRSLDEETSFRHDTPWGRLAFGFAERRPECLRSLVFDPQPR